MSRIAPAIISASGGGGLPGGMTKDPLLLPAFQGQMNLFNSSTQHYANASNFWSELGYGGAFVTGATDDTYKEICSLTGSGKLFHIIPPAHTNNSDVISFRITIDGVENEIIKDETWAGSGNDLIRVVLGVCCGYYTFNNSNGYSARFDFADAENYTTFRKAVNTTLMPPSEIMSNSMPCLRFEESLIVETKVTDVYTGASYGSYCGASYILD